MRPYLWSPWRTAEQAPQRLAVSAGDQSCTFAELCERADRLAAGMSATGIAPGQIISTDIEPGPRFFALALAALRYGYGLFPVGKSQLARLAGAAMLNDLDVRLHVGSAGVDVPIIDDEALTVAGGHISTKLHDAPRAGHLVFATSGTTGEPQAVARARPQRSYRGVAVHERYAAGIRFGAHVMANPTFHLGTLGPALYALQAGSPVVVQQHWSADGFADIVDEHGADSAFLSPDLLVDVVANGRSPRRRLTAAFHGGAACPPSVKHAAVELLGPILHEYYGTSRSILTEITTAEWLCRPGSVGRPLPGISLEIRRAGRPCPAGVVGEIVARLRPADEDGSGLLHTGDIGFLDEHGYLSIVGRADRTELWDATRLEHEIRLLPGITDAVVVGERDVACHVEIRPDDGTDRTAIIRSRAASLGLTVTRVHLAPSGSLPRTPSGKIRRAELSQHHRG